MLNKKIIPAILGAILIAPTWVSADSMEKVVPPKFSANTSETILKTFVYSPDKVFEIQSRVGMWTVITLPDDEQITGFLPSDTTFWNAKVTKDRKRAMVRPTDEGRFNSASLITNKHTYELTFKSYGKGFAWYQRVNWSFNDDEDPAFGIFSGDAVNLTSIMESDSDKIKSKQDNAKAADPTNWNVDISNAHFNYKIQNSKGAKFAPTRVFDDGVFTYIQMPKVQDLPALFAIGENDQVRLVDYVVKNNYILVHRVLPGLLFKLDGEEVTVRRYE